RRPTSSAHFAAAVTRHSGFRTSTKIMIAADASPSTIPAPATQRITFSVLPENRPSWVKSLASVRVVAVVVELQLGHLMGVLADLFREVERHVGRALVVVAALAILGVRVDGAQLDQLGPLVLLVVLLVGRILLAGTVAGFAAHALHQGGAQLLLLRPLLADLGIAAGLSVAGHVAGDAAGLLGVVFRRVEVRLLPRLEGLVGLERGEGLGHLRLLLGGVLLEVALLAGLRAHVLRFVRAGSDGRLSGRSGPPERDPSQGRGRDGRQQRDSHGVDSSLIPQ